VLFDIILFSYLYLQNQVMVALIGPSIFNGSFYPTVHTVQIRLEYLVTGYDVTQVSWLCFVLNQYVNLDIVMSFNIVHTF